MTSKTFVSGTTIDSAWLNDVDGATYEGTAVYTPAGAGAEATTMQAKLREEHSFFDKFTAAEKADALSGSPVLDHTASMQSAIDTAQEGATIKGTPGATFNFTNLLSAKALTLDFQGSSLIVDPTPIGVTTGTPAIRFAGTRGTGYAINSKTDFTANLTMTTAGDSAQFAAGDWVVVEDAAPIQKWDASGVGYTGRGQITRVKSSAAGVVTLSQAVEHFYQGATAKLYKITPVVGPRVLNIGSIREIDPGGITTGTVEINAPHLIEFAYCIRPKAASITAQGWNLFAVHFAYCVQASHKRVNALDPFRPANGGHGYMMRFYRCSGGVAQLSRAERCRHAVDFTNTYDSISRDNISIDPVGISFLWHGLASRRCKSVNDTTLAPPVNVSDTGGWGIGNGSFDADYDVLIDSPTYRGGCEAVTVYTHSDNVQINRPDIKVTDISGTSVRGVIVGYGAGNVAINGGIIDMSGATNASSHAVLSRDNSPALTGNVTISGTKLIPSSGGATPVYASQTGGGLSVVGCPIEGSGTTAIETALAQAFLHIVGNQITGTWTNGIKVNNAPSGSYVVTGNIDAGVITTFTTLSANANLVALFNGKTAQTLKINGAAATNRGIEIQTAGSPRWIIRATNTAESGSNAGSDLAFMRRTDAGADNGAAMILYRDSGRVDLVAGGTWQVPLKVGTYYLFVSTDGKLRIKASTLPTSDTDGTIVGTQT